MWVSKTKLEALEKRIEELERTLRWAPDNYEFTVFKELSPSEMIWLNYGSRPKSKIGVKAVIESILEKLGMKLTYVEGHPEKVEVLKKVKKAA